MDKIDLKYCDASGNSLIALYSFIVKIYKKNNNESIIIKNILESQGSKIKDVYDSILETIFTEDNGYIWTLSKALLGLLVVDLEKFEDSKKRAIINMTNNIETQEKYNDAANILLCDVQDNLTAKNKEIFTKNFRNFRQAINSIN